MHNYLLEIGTEEIPAKFMPGVLAQMHEHAQKQFKEHRITYNELKILGTPRRLTLLAYDLSKKGEDLKEEVKGPAKKAAYSPDGQLTKAALGFARSQGVTVEDLFLKDMGNTEYVYAIKEIKGKPTREVLPEIAIQLIASLNFPKPMRWSDLEMRFARPIRWLVSLFDNDVIPFELAGLTADRVSRGHRILGKENLVIDSPLTYMEQLEKEYVLVDQDLRREECWRQIKESAAKIGGRVEVDAELLEEVTYLLEWPTALAGTFEKSYLAIPEEVIITPMREHQRYFPVRTKDGELMNYFITVRNGDDRHLDTVRQGNEKVLKARLADARFFWDEDQKQKLAQYLPRLEKIVFQESLGTVAQKVERIIRNTEALAQRLSLNDSVTQRAKRAAQLAKADLVTNMVYEFPELQGIMGQYYADISGEDKVVSQAIKEHYQPRFASDDIPSGVEGALVSMADKLDTIVGCFAIGIEPTGSQDPYALRRQAMGICLILMGHSFELELDDLIRVALNNYKGVLGDDCLGEDTKDKIKEFFQARIRNILSEEGHRYDVVDAVLGVDYSSLLTTLKRAEALSKLKEEQKFVTLLTSYTRAYNLTKKTTAKDIHKEYFVEVVERELYDELKKAEEKIDELSMRRDFIEVIGHLSMLAMLINRFFDDIMVMVEDENIRDNRLALLHKVVALTRRIGDLSKIMG
ncbi:MAG: glycine--tRNA ligase subunit beta [Firmicutes bacterium HGW-Firmicutes-12]|jgi:glycyl-tRNA synthetase beta chain|nr:MAG: glycine--tRNA ligase subunit beta [Firmicutes bacterium HGW-Firmicutes-12]